MVSGGQAPAGELLAELDAVDPMDAAAAARFAEALAAPQAIELAEEVELRAKRVWAPLLDDASVTAERAARFSSFFAAIGFVRKYKPYGVKLAAPFGYSLFALEPGMGFSVQLHKVAKVEAFHILAARPGGFVLLCDKSEWDRDGAAFVDAWMDGAPASSELAFAPAPGDVLVVDRLELVHAIVGCVLEEFATTSNDAVERLFDQNASTATALPAAHASVAELLASCGEVPPRRRVSRQAGAWRTEPLADGAGTLVDLPRDGLRGSHLVVREGSPAEVRAPRDAIVTLACLAGSARMTVSGEVVDLPLGATAPVAPGATAALEAASESARVAVCSVAAELALGDYRTT
jgi:hypothetical protein